MSAREQAPYDLSGYWTSVITQNWQFRMVVPGPGEYADIPINAKAKQLADAFRASADMAAGKQCEAYGAAALMRLPEHLHVHWQDADVLRVDTDAGMQTRLLHFRAAAADTAPEPSTQGWSAAKWVLPTPGAAPAPPAGAANAPQAHYGSLQVLTDHLLPGLLRKNGVPYSAQTRLTEWWDLRVEPEGDQWLTITSTVEDPQYLQAPLIYDSIFQKEPDSSKWAPAPCSLTS
ncbi:MAG TPA: hypothetical protein VHY19_01615 [Steroidobacteraceae bacterium]|jgi:hypothetical protein|nr:hypothetical protein [Steroidobacteraceae bacterium]